MVLALTKRESEIYRCACMILNDQCPPDRKYYLCLRAEDDSIESDCLLCWDNYLRSIAAGTIELPKAEGRWRA